MSNPNLNDFTFDEKYQAANALLNVPDNSFQEASSEQPDLNLNQQNMNEQPDLNLNQQNMNKQPDLNLNLQNMNKQPDLNLNLQNMNKQPSLNLNLQNMNKQPSLNLNLQNMNKQPDLNLNQQEIPNHQFNLNQSIMNYAAQLNGLQINPNENITSNINKLLFIELLNLSQPGQSLNHSAVPQSKDIKLVPSSNLENNSLDSKDKVDNIISPPNNSNSEDIKLVPSSNLENNSLDSKDKVDNIISPPNNSNIKDIKLFPSSTFKAINLDSKDKAYNIISPHKNSNIKDIKLVPSSTFKDINLDTNHNGNFKVNNLNSKKTEEKNQENDSISSISIPLEAKLTSLIESLNATNQTNQMIGLSFLISNKNTTKMLVQQEKMIDQQGKILELLMEERNERKQKEKNAELSKNGKKNSDI